MSLDAPAIHQADLAGREKALPGIDNLAGKKENPIHGLILREPVVFGVRSDPHPGDRVAGQTADRPVMISGADGEKVAALQTSET